MATRTLGILAGLASFVAGVGLLLAKIQHIVIDIFPLIWATLDQVVVFFPFTLPTVNEIPAIVLLISGALALWSVALALDPGVRGFGTLFAWALFALASTLVGLVSGGVLIALAVALTVLASYAATRSSGALAQRESPPIGLIMGLFASLLLAVGILTIQTRIFASQPPDMLSVALVLTGCLMLVGHAPFHHVLDEIVEAPAALSGLLYGVVLPVLAFGTLFRFLWVPNTMFASLPMTMPSFWQVPLLLIGTGGLLVSGAAALRERHMRRLLGWQMSGQAGVVLLALALGGPLAKLAASALLVNMVAATLAAALAIAVLEHITGSDDLTQDLAEKQGVIHALRIPGFVWALAAMAALGLPPFWGFWGRYWLVQALEGRAAWVLPFMFAASTLAALAYLVPLARYWWPGDWRSRARSKAKESRVPISGRLLLQDTGKRGSSETGKLSVQSAGMQTQERKTTPLPHYLSPLTYALLPALVLVPLLLAGVAPSYVWDGWLRWLLDEPLPFVIPYPLLLGNIIVLVSGLLVWPFVRRITWKRRTRSDEDMVHVGLAPDALANSLAPLAQIGRPNALLHNVWNVLKLFNKGVSFALAPFEQRYYLAGVVLALISLIVLIAQG
jgi:formate hydrogenlyase subunit 3/multisubunit Na+/H+ antiporter MnhD subunit